MGQIDHIQRVTKGGRADRVKRGVAYLAMLPFIQNAKLLDGTIEYEPVAVDPNGMQLMIRVQDPGKGLRYFSVTVKEVM